MQLSELRREIAPLLETTDSALRVRQQALYQIAALQHAGMRGWRGGGESGITATTASAALLVLTGMLAGVPTTIGKRVLRLWRAHHQFAGPCEVTGARILGDALVTVLEDPQIRVQLQWFDIDPRAEVGMLYWTDREAPSVFHPHNDREWARRIRKARASAGTMITLKRLPVGGFNKIAARL